MKQRSWESGARKSDSLFSASILRLPDSERGKQKMGLLMTSAGLEFDNSTLVLTGENNSLRRPTLAEKCFSPVLGTLRANLTVTL